MHVNLLGPLKVYRSDNSANSAPAAQKMRQTLAVLTLNANKTVRAEQLIDEIWEKNPPASVSTALQTYIYQLRKRYGLGRPRNTDTPENTGSPLLRTVGGGYQLAISNSCVDAFNFEQLVLDARKEFRSGNISRARNSVTTAMTLWRDSALVDVRKGAILAAEALRLSELHLSAKNLRIEADLKLGRHYELISELTSLAALEPTNEGVQRNLMLALYRTGRRMDALRVYHRTRERFAEELGLDPSPELEALHTAILKSDESLMTPTVRSSTLAHSAPQIQAPCHLPPAQTRFVGRSGQLARAVHALTTTDRCGPALVVVNGPPASGKSELLAQVAHQARNHYPDGQLYARLIDDDNQPAKHARILRSFLRGLGVPEAELERSVTDLNLMFRTWTAKRRVLVVLDDVTGAADLPLLLPSGKECATLISGRRRLFTPSVTESIDLDRLSHEDGVQLLASAVPGHRVAKEPESIRQLVDLCEGLPTALYSVAAKLQLRPHWTAVQAIAWTESSRPEEEDRLGLQASLARTLRTLRPQVRHDLYVLACADPPLITPRSTAAVLGTDETLAEGLLEELVETHLLRASANTEDGWFSYTWEPPVHSLQGALRRESAGTWLSTGPPPHAIV